MKVVLPKAYEHISKIGLLVVVLARTIVNIYSVKVSECGYRIALMIFSRFVYCARVDEERTKMNRNIIIRTPAI